MAQIKAAFLEWNLGQIVIRGKTKPVKKKFSFKNYSQRNFESSGTLSNRTHSLFEVRPQEKSAKQWINMTRLLPIHAKPIDKVMKYFTNRKKYQLSRTSAHFLSCSKLACDQAEQAMGYSVLPTWTISGIFIQGIEALFNENWWNSILF